jgi:hypothetical protein
MDDAIPRPSFSAQDLSRWEDNGAGWRVIKADDESVVVELCTCTGEPVDVVEAAPDLLELFRSGAIGVRSE